MHDDVDVVELVDLVDAGEELKKARSRRASSEGASLPTCGDDEVVRD